MRLFPRENYLKKIRGFYRDLEREHHCTYTTDGNMLINGDLA